LRGAPPALDSATKVFIEPYPVAKRIDDLHTFRIPGLVFDARSHVGVIPGTDLAMISSTPVILTKTVEPGQQSP